MNAETIRGFFEGRVKARLLAAEAGTADDDVRHASDDVLTDDLSADFLVSANHLAALCDAVVRNEMKPCHLEVIASVLVRSERFTWIRRR